MPDSRTWIPELLSGYSANALNQLSASQISIFVRLDGVTPIGTLSKMLDMPESQLMQELVKLADLDLLRFKKPQSSTKRSADLATVTARLKRQSSDRRKETLDSPEKALRSARFHLERRSARETTAKSRTAPCPKLTSRRPSERYNTASKRCVISPAQPRPAHTRDKAPQQPSSQAPVPSPAQPPAQGTKPKPSAQQKAEVVLPKVSTPQPSSRNPQEGTTHRWLPSYVKPARKNIGEYNIAYGPPSPLP